MKALLEKLSLVSYDGQLSLTNIALYVCLGKLLFTKEPTLVELGALILALANYAHKRQVNSKAHAQELEVERAEAVDMTQLKAELDTLKQQVFMLEGGRI